MLDRFFRSLQSLWPTFKPYVTDSLFVVSRVGSVVYGMNKLAIVSFYNAGNAQFYFLACCSLIIVGKLGGWRLLITIMLGSLSIVPWNKYAGISSFIAYVLYIYFFFGSFWTSFFVFTTAGILLAMDTCHLSSTMLIISSTFGCLYLGGISSVGSSWAFACLAVNLLQLPDAKDKSPVRILAAIRNIISRCLKRLLHIQTSTGSQSQPARPSPSTRSQESPTKPGKTKPVGRTEAPPSSATPGVSLRADGDVAPKAAYVSSPTVHTAAEVSPEAEVLRILACKDHYAVLGLPKFEEFLPNVLKKEYRKKAVLVHPDKHGGKSQACDAFKKLHEAYEILLDDTKREEYHTLLKSELVRDELTTLIRTMRATVSGRKVFCANCRYEHVWTPVDRRPSEARWCQDCKEFHPAKEGDGWMEQKQFPNLLGLFPRVAEKQAFTLSGGRVYEITDWAECQRLKCPPNTHEPTFVSQSANVYDDGHGLFNLDSLSDQEVVDFLSHRLMTGEFDVDDVMAILNINIYPTNIAKYYAPKSKKKKPVKKAQKSRRTKF